MLHRCEKGSRLQTYLWYQNIVWSAESLIDTAAKCWLCVWAHLCVCFYCMAGSILLSESRAAMLPLRAPAVHLEKEPAGISVQLEQEESWTEDNVDSMNWSWCSVVPPPEVTLVFFFFSQSRLSSHQGFHNKVAVLTLHSVAFTIWRPTLARKPFNLQLVPGCLLAHTLFVLPTLKQNKTKQKRVATYSNVSGETSRPCVLKMQLSTCLDSWVSTGP